MKEKKTMKLSNIMFIIMILASFARYSYTQIYQVYEFEPVIVYSSKIGTRINQYPGIVSVIEKKELNKFKATNLNEILNSLTSIDVKTRGAQGIQGDPSINGLNFEQILIMINGVPLNDPQTGHHNLDLPINVENIERIEVISGGNSPVNGQNAFGGVINVILKNDEKNEFSIKTIAGSHKYKNLDFGLNKQMHNKIFNICYNHNSSDGYRFNTDFKINRLNLFTTWNISKMQLEFITGYQDKEFGANSFYSDKYPNQRENTRSVLAIFNIKKYIKGSLLKINFYSKHHYDHFLLDFLNPSFYENEHNKYTFGITSDFLFKYKKITTNISVRINKDQITSNRLGKHDRIFYGFSTTSGFTITKSFSVKISSYINYYEKWGLQVWPGLALSYSINNKSIFFTNINKSFRIPTYTELYYKSPANVGNSNLKPEKVFSIQSGYRYTSGSTIISISSFYNNAYNTIDWIRYSNNDPWMAINIGKIHIFGIQYSQKTKISPHISFSISYTNNFYKLFSYGSNQSKYKLDNLKYKLTLNTNFSFSEYTSLTLFFDFYKRKKGDQINLMDVLFTKHLKSLKSDFFIKMENVFNLIYEDYPGVILPGRWIKVGLVTRI